MITPYDTIAAQWIAARRSFRPKEADYLSVLLESTDQRLPLLDLGCGSGRPFAEFLARADFQLVGVDRSEALLAEARKVVPHARWIRAEMETVEFDEHFGAVVCWDALFHLERRYHRPVIEKIHRWLTPGGRLMFSAGGSPNPPFRDRMWDHEFFYDSHAPDETLRIVEEVGFQIVLSDFAELPDGDRNKGKFAVVAEKSSTSPPQRNG